MKQFVLVMLFSMCALAFVACKVNRIVMTETQLPQVSTVEDVMVIEEDSVQLPLLEPEAKEDLFKSNDKIVDLDHSKDSVFVMQPTVDSAKTDSMLEDKEPTAPNITL